MKSVLIVDDNLVSLKQMSVQLSHNYEISLAKSGELALQICAREKPDLILLDVEMPGMDGFATIKQLKENPDFQHIPVIFLTGNADAETEVKCLESGAMDFITKPANADILHHRIALHIQFSEFQLRLEQIVNELEDNIGISFAELLDCKDYNAAGHLLRSAEYAEILAKKLLEEGVFGDELTAENVDMLKRAAPFHDIGKIGISDIILLKREPLTKTEYEEICRHSALGGDVLRMIYKRTPNQEYLKTAITIAEGHHERYDGTGYPKGLKGDEIPLCCRIMSVVNVYDACVSNKVYRKGLPPEEAFAIIQEGRGTAFDPRIVDAFGKIYDNIIINTAEKKSEFNEWGWSLYHETNTGS
ncbi:MAG: response regulator [Treponema sp.]|nr:response regulator [Treponema sp.]